ncbi:hypothetical protein N7541_002467, partial [Penicillium brevicompactum]
ENGTKVSQRYPETVLSKSHQDLLSRVPGKKALRACSMCQTVITEDQLSEDPDQARFWVIRNLGSCKWPPSRSWFDQCRFTGVNFWKSHSYWFRLQNSSSMTKEVHTEWEQDYCLKQQGRLIQKRREASQYFDEGTPICIIVPVM